MLSLEGVHTYYGDSHVLQGINLHVAAGECVAILGRNGAGKTTIMRSILGLVPARRGRITFNSRDITAEQTFRIARSGVGYVPENRGIFNSVTVDEHLALAGGLARPAVGGYTVDRIHQLFPRLALRGKSLGNQLSGGEQQMLAIARALILNPELLLLDEPSEGLAPTIVDYLEEILKDIIKNGTPILLVEQNYYLAMALATKVYVLSQGQVVFSGTPAELSSNEDVMSTYLSI
jgi:branched-chain amino acid transport system ATP-binding protein